MSKNKFSHLRKRKGVTLIEMLAVILILGIIALIAVPAVMDTIETQRVKSFGQDLAALEKQATLLKPYTTMLDYDKLETGGNLDADKINALAQNGELPFFAGADPDAGSVKVTVSYTEGADGRVYSLSINGSTFTSEYSKLPEQLGSVFATTEGVEKELRLYPIDVELIYTINGLTNELAYPKSTDIYAGRYQGKTDVTTANINNTSLLFPTTPNTPGFFFAVGGNGKIVYTGTDAATDDGLVIHVAGAGSN